MRLLAQTKESISIKFPLTKRRPFRYALVRPGTSVPSTNDFMRVNHATVREGKSHRVWPPEVVRAFQTAEIITDLQTPHYVVRDSSISQVTR